MIRCAGDRRDRPSPPRAAAAAEAGEARCGCSCPPGFAEVAGQQARAASRGSCPACECGACWMPRSSKIDTLAAARDARGRPRARRSSATPARRAVRGDVDRARARRATSSSPTACSASQPSVEQVLLDEHREQRGQAATRRCPGAPAGGCRPARRSRCAAGRSTISARSGSLAISFSIVRARGKPCDCHGFLPTNTATSACSKSPVVWQRGRRTAGRRPRTRRSSPARARSSGTRCPSAARVAAP